MKVGTKSVLFGAHQFLIHPWFVAAGWTKLYGFPFDPRLWVAFFVHDIGYLGKPNMDGPEGETHVELGANIMRKLFGKEWGDFTMHHSRFYAKRNGVHFSRLCVADKLSLVITPWWIYLPLLRASGEIYEYIALEKSKYAHMSTKMDWTDHKKWILSLQKYLIGWVEEHKDLKEDTWTKI